MKKWVQFLAFSLLILTSCTQKNKEEKKFISIPSFIRSQVAQVDTSLYSIIRLDYRDSSHVDTTYIKREDFRAEAKDFLDLPDISDKKNSKNYREESRFDETLNTVVLTYLPENPDKELIQRQEMLIRPDPGGDKVRTIIIDYLLNNRDSTVRKRMLWQVDRSFQVTRISQKPGSPETISTVKLIWNEEEQP